MMRSLKGILMLLLLADFLAPGWGGVLLEPKKAPEWRVQEWINSDPGNVASLRGKVVLINFFQLWCPACNDFSIPLFKEWEEKFGDNEELVIVSIHTVFEGHDEQTPAKLRAFVREKGITHPVGVDAYMKNNPVPQTMELYETGGTPHVAIIDKTGDLVFSHFGRFDPAPIDRFVTRLLDKKKPLGSTIVKPDRPVPRNPTAGLLKKDEPEAQPKQPPARQASNEDDDDKEEEEEDDSDPDKELSGSYKLRFEPLTVSCGEVGSPVDVITQVTVKEQTIVAKFSRPYAGLRALTVNYDAGSGDFDGEVEKEGTERGGAKVDVSVQVSGRFVTIAEPPEIEYDFYVEKRSEDGSSDCVIEGRGGGARFRTR
jgi:thiol-disulfide isomerase/thioredoxin